MRLLANSNIALHQDLHWATDIQHALEDNRLSLDAQPIFDAQTSQTMSRFELLLRLRADNGQTVTPGQFMPALERYGRLAVQLDCWVVISLLEWLQGDSDNHRAGLCAVNLSTPSLRDEAFLAFLSKQLSAAGERLAGKICFEIKEAALLEHRASVLRFIRTLHSYGCQFTLDNFGNDWNSCRHLKQLPFDLVKISGALVQGIGDDQVDYTIVKAIIEAGQLTGKRMIAAWVEDAEVYRRLVNAGVDFAQGNYLGQAKPLTELRLH